MDRLLAYSFHSVKGGVGKSTLSVITARWMASRLHPTPVVLLDMDLTGTSLADVLPLRAPRWEGVNDSAALDLLVAPTAQGPHTRAATEARIEARRSLEPGDTHVVGVPFLGDFLLHATPSWEQTREISMASLLWAWEGAPDNLHVIPSSALPNDLERILPVIFSEETAAYLEGRLERLVDGLLTHFQGHPLVLVVDTPPTLPGLSRSVLSLGLRLNDPEAEGNKRPLVEGHPLPGLLGQAAIRWHASVVASPDVQDLRAAVRWLDLVNLSELDVIGFLINRCDRDDAGRRDDLLRSARFDGLEASPLGNNPLLVKEQTTLRLFHTGADAPEAPAASTPEVDTLERWWSDGETWMRGGTG